MFSKKTLRAHQKKKDTSQKWRFIKIYKNINVINNHFEKIKYIRMKCQRTTKILIKMCLTRWLKDLRTVFKEINSNTEWKGQRSWTLDLFWKRNLDTAGEQSDFVQFSTYKCYHISRYWFLFSSCAYLEFCNLVSQCEGPKVLSTTYKIKVI